MYPLYNQSTVYDPRTGYIFELKNNHFVRLNIPFADTEEQIKTKLFPTIVHPEFVNVLRGHAELAVKEFTPPSTQAIKVSSYIVHNDPAFGLFGFKFEHPDIQTEIKASVAQLAYAYNTDPVGKKAFVAYIKNVFETAGHKL